VRDKLVDEIYVRRENNSDILSRELNGRRILEEPMQKKTI
jgi:hypothetical protein